MIAKITVINCMTDDQMDPGPGLNSPLWHTLAYLIRLIVEPAMARIRCGGRGRRALRLGRRTALLADGLSVCRSASSRLRDPAWLPLGGGARMAALPAPPRTQPHP
jgi:hypothetical protein